MIRKIIAIIIILSAYIAMASYCGYIAFIDSPMTEVITRQGAGRGMCGIAFMALTGIPVMYFCIWALCPKEFWKMVKPAGELDNE